MARPRSTAFHRLYRSLTGDMERGGWAPGAMLPPEAELAHVHGTTRGTVRGVLQLLADEGRIAAQRSRGWLVLEQHEQTAGHDSDARPLVLSLNRIQPRASMVAEGLRAAGLQARSLVFEDSLDGERLQALVDQYPSHAVLLDRSVLDTRLLLDSSCCGRRPLCLFAVQPQEILSSAPSDQVGSDDVLGGQALGAAIRASGARSVTCWHSRHTRLDGDGLHARRFLGLRSGLGADMRLRTRSCPQKPPCGPIAAADAHVFLGDVQLEGVYQAWLLDRGLLDDTWIYGSTADLSGGHRLAEPWKDMGRIAGQLLLDRLAGLDQPARRVLVAPHEIAVCS